MNLGSTITLTGPSGNPPLRHIASFRSARSQSLLEQPPGQTAHPHALAHDYGDVVRESATWAEWRTKGWEVFVHPTGVLYYHNSAENITTSLDLLNLAPAAIELPGNMPRGLAYERLLEDDGGLIYVDHRMKAISFLNQDPREFQQRLQAGKDLRLTARYWAFVQAYPCHSSNSEITRANDGWISARDALQWCYADRLLFGHSNSTFSKGDSKELLELLISMREDYGPVRNWLIACILRAIYTDRVMTSYGKPNASELRRREREETPHLLEKPTWFLAVLYYFVGSIICLGVPYVYFFRVQRVDRTRFGDGVSTERWRSFVSSLSKEWRDSNLVATVLLAANVSFLAIPDLDSTSLLLSMLSIIASTGSVIMGFFLVWRHQPQEASSGEIGLRYFMHTRLRTGSSIPLSFALCIPLVLLLWAFLGFLAAICVHSFLGQQGGPGFKSIPIPSSTSFSVIGMLSLLATTAVFAWIFFTDAWSPVMDGHYAPNSGGDSRASHAVRPPNGSGFIAALHELPSWERGQMHRESINLHSPGPTAGTSRPLTVVFPSLPIPLASPQTDGDRTPTRRGYDIASAQTEQRDFGSQSTTTSSSSSAGIQTRPIGQRTSNSTMSDDEGRRAPPRDVSQLRQLALFQAAGLRAAHSEDDNAHMESEGHFDAGPLTTSPSFISPSLATTPASSFQTASVLSRVRSTQEFERFGTPPPPRDGPAGADVPPLPTSSEPGSSASSQQEASTSTLRTAQRSIARPPSRSARTVRPERTFAVSSAARVPPGPVQALAEEPFSSNLHSRDVQTGRPLPRRREVWISSVDEVDGENSAVVPDET